MCWNCSVQSPMRFPLVILPSYTHTMPPQGTSPVVSGSLLSCDGAVAAQNEAGRDMEAGGGRRRCAARDGRHPAKDTLLVIVSYLPAHDKGCVSREERAGSRCLKMDNEWTFPDPPTCCHWDRAFKGVRRCALAALSSLQAPS